MKFREERSKRVATYDEFKALMEVTSASSSRAGAAAPSARHRSKPTQATLRNIPFGSQNADPCVKRGRPAAGEAWFAKAHFQVSKRRARGERLLVNPDDPAGFCLASRAPRWCAAISTPSTILSSTTITIRFSATARWKTSPTGSF